ncbi:autotransporter-associated beta strand repeat-containing protein [Prosthecobacter sp.]|uniref:autotransporter-associated beta strand repeat-containing protein n=1 Tax=Prosthecobacter sp. TaxID=1965333 RepID=UPI002ABC881D|nr:autotransporter-associated beta strand repeat-containing protein [Prosthecobacter sp.]MDZ4402047.1 autotransporter-associated beta strand repeat-containing protein [Prosthecobacter sp.]
MKHFRAYRRSISTLMISLMAFWQIAQPLQAATFYWDTDTSTAGNNADGTGLGGTGTWNTSTMNWWDTTNLVVWPNTNVDEAVFSVPFSILPTLNTVTLISGITANQLRFLRSGYTLTGGDLTLAGTTPTLHANLGESATIDSQILGSAGFTKTGGGSIRLSNNVNAYTGITTISNGSLIITGQGALGASGSPIVVAAFNPYVGASSLGVNNLRGFGGGSLVLDGTGGNITISRDLSLQGRGPVGDNGAALVSTGNNTLSGTVDMGVAFSGTNMNTRIIAADGTLNLTGPLNVQGVAATTINSLGGINQAGASSYDISGVLAGSGTLEKSGGGTLFLSPSDSSGFSGTIRVSGSAASGQSEVRIDSPGVLGTRTSGTTGAVLDLNGGILAVLMDTPDVKVSNGTNANVYFRAASTIFADHTPGSSAKDQTVAFGNMSFEDNITLTFNSRNGYGMSFTTAPVNGGNEQSTFTNNLQGGALLSFTGNFWSNTDNGAARTMTIGGAGNTLINGSIIATSVAFNHNLTKTGAGTLTLTGTASTLDGNVSVNGGTVAISDWRAITNNTSTVNINAGILSVIGNNVSLANLTTSKVINLSGTTGAATILANQTGTSPGLVLNADFTATGAGTKTLTLGGTNIGANTINGAIVQNGSTLVTKIDAGRWILAGTNTYTGATTISNGTLQLKANAASSTILADASAIVFNATNVYAGGILELLGQASTNNVETLGVLTPTAGSGTVRLTPGSGGTASIVFASLGAVGGGSTVNIVAPTSGDTVKFTTTAIVNNIANAGLYYNGSDFAFVPGAATALRAPNYTTDTDFATTSTALTAARSMEITGAGFSNAAVTIDSLRINGATALNMTGLLTIRTAGTANASGGIIQTGGSGSITGTGVSTGGSGALVINVDGGANSLSLDAPITATTTGGFTKVGAGTLRLGGTNAQTGTITINEGTVRLAGADRLGAAAALTIRQDGILELNGVTLATSTNAFNNNGIVRNTSATTDVTFTVGGANGTGTSLGIIEDGGVGKVSVVKLGTGGQSWLGLSTYTGSTTIGSTGIVTINNLQNGTNPSGIGASSNAASNLIFNGTSATQAYGGLSYTGTTNDETDRLFTFNGGADGGARIQSNGVNGATSSWTNTGALLFGANATGNPQGLVLGGASTGDNRFFPIINDNGAAATSVYKADAGLWFLEATNGYSGATTIRGGALSVSDGISLPTASNLVLDGGSLASSGAFSRAIGTGADQVQWTAHGAGGFSAGGSPLTVDLGTGNVWGSTAGFLGTGALLLNNSGVSRSDVDIISGFEITLGAAVTVNATTTAASATVTLTSGTTAGLAIGQTIANNPNIPAGYTIATITSPTTFTLNSATGVTAGTSVATDTLAGGYRQINVGDFTSVGSDFATISGIITGAGNLAKEGTGILNLRAANTYTGQTLLRAGTLVVETLGLSTSPGNTSVGNSALGNTDAGAIAIGNGGTGAGILEYVGTGETSDRKIRLNTTTGSVQLHADGTGPLILTNVANDMVAGAKTLFLRGVNAGGNMITSQLSDNGGILGVTVDSSATWILTNNNNYTGGTSVTGGALGIGHDNALGGTGTLTISNGTVFAYGGDRTISNPITQSATSGTIAGFTGDYSINLTGLWTDPSTTSTTRFIRNNIVSGKTLTLSGNYSATAGTTSLGIGFDGSGDTILNGIFSSTMPSFGVIYAGTGSLTLGGANTYTGRTRITSGTLRLGANEVIPNGAVNPANNEVVLDPGLGLTATLDLNGKTETINGLTANTAGTAIIDNTSGTAASLTFGANDQAVTIGGIGNYTITDSGAGALSITKTGTASASILTGVTLTYQGTTNVNGGSMSIASALNGTTGLSVTNSGSALTLSGGITSPSAITSVVVENGGLLNLLDGAGSKFSGLTSLQLGSSGGTMTSLNLNVGDLTVDGDELNTDTFILTTGGTLSLFTGNQITFNLTDTGLNAGQTYELLNFVDGGFTSGVLANTDYILGATPGGFSSITLTANNNSVFITTGTLITGSSYWRGLTDNTWNANANNWSQDKAGTTPALSTPGQGTDVIFQWDAPTNAAVTTTLEQNFKVNSLTFEASTTPANTPTSVTIGPGLVTTNRIEIAPQLATDGIKITAGGPAAVTISGPVRLGGLATSQTWNVADAGSVLSLGSLLGERDVTKTGLGKVTLTAAADPTFNSGDTADVTINAGTLEMTNVAALGDAVNGNFATVTVNTGGVFFYNGAASTTTNLAMPLTLAGGTLSAGTATQTYSGTVNVSGNSFINMRDSNSAVVSTAARSITLTNVLSGSGRLTVDSVDTLTAGNAETGTLTINNLANTWDGELAFERGTVDFTSLPATAANAGHIGAVTFNTLGRVIYRNINGQTLNRTGALTFAAGSIGEVLIDNISAVLASDYVVNQNGVTTLGSGGTGASARFTVNDASSTLNLAGNVILGGNSSISADGGDADSFVTISGIISDGGSGYSLAINDDAGAWAVTNDIIRLTGANSFTGNISLSEGALEFNTVTDISGGASSLGNGAAVTIAGGTLRFIGASAQSTNRPISITGTGILSANGTGGAAITYSGAINIVSITDGTKITLTGAAGSEGIISGGITQTGDEADMTVTGGTWTHTTATSRVGDAMVVTGADTILNLNSGLFQVRDDFAVIAGATLNLNGTGVLSYNTPTLTSGTLQAYTNGVINLGANDAVVATEFDELRIGTDGAGVGTFNMSTFNQTVTGFIFGNRNLDRSGLVNGTGTLTVTGNFDLYGGTVNANLASPLAATEAMEKISSNTVTLTGDNSGLLSTGDTIVYDGILNLNYTVSNTPKINVTQPLDMRGARVNLIGNNGAATTQSVTGLTLATGGSSTIQVTGGTGQDAVLNFGAITRGNLAQDGTIRLMLPGGTQSATNGITTTSPNSAFGMLGTGATVTSDAAYATVEDGTGTWFATKNTAGVGLGNIVALASTPKNDVTTWLTGDHITDETTGFTGTLQRAFINSLRFNTAGGSDVAMSNTGVLIIGSGGFLITSNVGGTPSMMGGTLASGATELVITQDSTQSFEISSDIRINQGVTKTGAGTLLLSGNNVYTGLTEIQEGTLQVSGNSIGDTSIVTLSASRPTTLELLADETIGRLQGGSRNTDGDYGTVAVGSHTLTINNSGGSTTFAGFFTGDGNIIKQGTHNLALSNVSTGFTGILTVESGLVTINGIGQINASNIRINKGGTLDIDNTATTITTTRILDTTPITLNSADGFFQASPTIVRGLSLRNNNDATRDETVGLITLNTGASYIGMEASSTNDDADFIISDLVRLNDATLNVRGTNLGGASSQENEFRIGDATNQTAFIANAANLVGGGGAAASQNISIVPWAIGESTAGALAATHMGNSLVTYVSGSGFRPLTLAEYNTFGAQVLPTDNIRESLTGALAVASGPAKTINALVLHNASLASATHAVTGAGVGESLAVTSGAMLFTLDPAAVAGDYGITFGGFDSGITVGATNEYVIHVVNPDSGAPTKALTATISSPLTSAADITKSGRGTLILSAVNTAGGGANKTTVNEGILEIADLDNIGGNTGSLVFAGGTLRLGTTLTDDISLRTITLLDGGGTIDTNTIDLALANSVGSGLGGLTKVGLGNLTLNAAATYTGATVVSGGTLTVGANNATGNGGALSIGAGATLALGTNSITASLVSTSGASPVITGTGTINASTGFFFSNTGDITVDAVLAGSGGLFKNQTNILTLAGLSTYTGTTEIQSGTLSFNSIANVGGGASALGAPTTAEAGIIRMGLTTTATTLTYTGTGHTSGRLIGMQGTTGAVTLNGSGSGAIGYGGARFEMAGNKTLNLGGTSDVALINSIGTLTEIGGVLSLIKTDTNTWNLNQSNSYTGATSINNGILRLSAVQNLTGALQFGSTNAITTAGSLEVQENATFGSMTVQTNSAVNTNNLSIDATKSLTINGNVMLGSSLASSTTLFAASGDGTFIVNNTVATGVTFQVGNANTNIATADFSALGAMNVSLNTTSGIMQVSSTSTTNSTGFGSLILAKDTTITASALTVGGAGSYNGNVGQVNSLKLGTTSNIIHVNAINIGTGLRDFGSVTFQDVTGTLTVRAADGVGRAAFNMGTTGGATGVATVAGAQNTFDVTGHNADLLLGAVAIGTQATRGDTLTNVFSFDTGTLDMTSLTMSVKTGTPLAGDRDVISTVNLGGGTVTIGSGILQMGQTSTSGNIATATLNVTGGDVTIGATSGTAITMASAAAGTTATGAVNLTGGTTTVQGDIVRTGGAGTTSATMTLDGGLLDMTGNDIGTGASTVTFAAQSGTLTKLGELNGGGVLDKTTTGTLTLTNGNAYTGGTTVTAGTLLAMNTTGSATGAGAVTILTTGTLGGTGTVAGNVQVNSGGTLAPGASAGQLTLTGTLNIDAGGFLLAEIGGATTNDAATIFTYFNANGQSLTGLTIQASYENYQVGVTQHDSVNVTGASTPAIAGTFQFGPVLGGYVPQYGDIFDLLDWTAAGDITGATTFDFTAITLGAGLGFNTDLFASNGIVVVVPEPSRALFLLLGLLGLMLRRRRR